MVQSGEKFVVSPAPHIRSGMTTTKIMWLVSLALMPALAGAVYFFGTQVLAITGVSIASALLTEALILRLRRKPVVISDGSAFLTGLLLAMNLPQNIPLWLPALGAVFAIAVVKQAFGGLGNNIFNPALAGRVFLILSYSKYMTTGWAVPSGGQMSVDSVTSATPLTVWYEANRALAGSGLQDSIARHAFMDLQRLQSPDLLFRLFTGNVGGSIGETSALLLLAGAIFLLLSRIITWHIPVSFLGSLALFTWIFWVPGVSEPFQGNALFHVLSGGAMLGAFFMATDMVTSPVSRKGKIVFGLGCGILTGTIRLYAGYPEGVSFAVLLMNAATPLIDRHIKPRRYGVKTGYDKGK